MRRTLPEKTHNTTHTLNTYTLPHLLAVKVGLIFIILIMNLFLLKTHVVIIL